MGLGERVRRFLRVDRRATTPQPEHVRSVERPQITSMQEYVTRWLDIAGGDRLTRVMGLDGQRYMVSLTIPEPGNLGYGSVYNPDTGQAILTYHHNQERLTSSTYYDYDGDRKIHYHEDGTFSTEPIAGEGVGVGTLPTEEVISILQTAPLPDDTTKGTIRRAIRLQDRIRWPWEMP